MRKLILFSFLLAIGTAFTGCGTLFFNNSFSGYTYPNSERYSAGDFTYAPSEIDRIEINWQFGKVNIIESDKAQLSVSESNGNLIPERKLHHFTHNRTLYIQTCRSGCLLNIGKGEKVLNIEIPSGISLVITGASADTEARRLNLKSLQFISASGSFEAESVTAEEIDISTASGETDIDYVKAESLSINSTSGDISLENANVDGDIVCKSVSGDVEIDGSDSENLKISTTSGKIQIDRATSEDKVNLSSISGDIESDRIKSDELQISTTSGKIEVARLESPSSELESISGDVEIGISDAGATVKFSSLSGKLRTGLQHRSDGQTYTFGNGEYNVKIKTTSGNVEIN